MVRYEHVCFESFGYVLPENVVTSAELEQELAPVYERFGVHQGRLELMTGIRERRFWDDGTLPSNASSRAGRRALKKSLTGPEEIECLINTSVSRDFLEPATASVVHDNLSLSPKALVYDISNACLGFLNGIISLANMIELGQVRKGLIVAGENSRNLVHTTIKELLSAANLTRQAFKAAFASLTIGSGAVGLVMAHDSVSQTGHRLLGGVARTATEHNDLCRGSADTGFDAQASMSMQTQAETLLVSGCALAAEAWSAFKQTLGWTHDDVGRTYCHQVGATHRDRLYESLGLDPAKGFSTFEFLGNVGSVSLPITMAMGIERDPPPRGEQIAMMGIGSGLSCVMLGVRW
ncbi:MAG: 3-oxoacyl-ACP synthase III [Phycisphaerae bacterium]